MRPGRAPSGRPGPAACPSRPVSPAGTRCSLTATLPPPARSSRPRASQPGSVTTQASRISRTTRQRTCRLRRADPTPTTREATAALGKPDFDGVSPATLRRIGDRSPSPAGPPRRNALAPWTAVPVTVPWPIGNHSHAWNVCRSGSTNSHRGLLDLALVADRGPPPRSGLSVQTTPRPWQPPMRGRGRTARNPDLRTSGLSIPVFRHQRGRVCWAASELSGGSFGSTFVEADADVHGGPLWDFDFGRFASARRRAARRGPPPALRDHGLCSPSPWRGRLTVRETSDGMNLPGSLGRSPGAIHGSSSDQGRGS